MSTLAGSFLVARPTLRDQNFTQTVVLVLQHGPEGAFGLVVNRPAEAEGLPFPVHTGGPCPSPGLVLLHGHEDWVEPGEEDEDGDGDGEGGGGQVVPGVFLGDAAVMARIKAADDPDALRYRLFLGYSGWGPDQLERELTEHTWHVVPATAELLFDTPPAELWDRLAPPAAPVPSVN
jgi:putative transcriptional regulator